MIPYYVHCLKQFLFIHNCLPFLQALVDFLLVLVVFLLVLAVFLHFRPPHIDVLEMLSVICDPYVSSNIVLAKLISNSLHDSMHKFGSCLGKKLSVQWQSGPDSDIFRRKWAVVVSFY